MKKVIILFLSVLTFYSCNKLQDLKDQLRTIQIPVKKGFTLPAFPKNEGRSVELNLDLSKSLLINEQISKLDDSVEDIYLKNASLELVSVKDLKEVSLSNLDFLDSFVIKAKFNGKTIDLAKNRAVEKGNVLMKLIPTFEKLDEMLKSSDVIYEVVYTSNKTVKDFSFKLKFDFELKLKI